MHALVAYFDTTFSACHKPVVLDTSPMEMHTHWCVREVLVSKTNRD